MATRKTKLSDGNAEADRLNRDGLKALYAAQSAASRKKEALQDPTTKQQLMDFLFSGPNSDVENPLADIK